VAGTCTAAHPRRRPLLRRRRHARPRTPPPTPTHPLAHASTADWYTGSSRKNDVAAHAAPHAPLPLPSVLSAPQHAHGAFFLMHSLTRRSHHPRWPRSTRAAPFSYSRFPPCSRPAIFPSCLQRTAPRSHTSTHAPTTHFTTLAHAHARTRAHGRPTANDATCGPPAWLTERLHDGGIRSVRSPLRQLPLLAIRIATPLQGDRPERPGLFVS